jgi:hypothetical protein
MIDPCTQRNSLRCKTWALGLSSCLVVWMVVTILCHGLTGQGGGETSLPPQWHHVESSPVQFDMQFSQTRKIFTQPKGQVRRLERERELDVELPAFFYLGVWEKALISYGETITTVANVQRPASALWVEEVACGHHWYFNAFQHDVINGMPGAGLMVSWVLEKPGRKLLCKPLVCDVLCQVLPKGSLVDVSQLENGQIWAERAFMPLPGRLDSYPFGAMWFVPTFMRQLCLGREASDVGRGHVIVLSRAFSSFRSLTNEGALIQAIKAATSPFAEVTVIGRERLVTDLNLAKSIYQANVVVGLHGGLFSNIVFCNEAALVIEINNSAGGRDCFANVALTLGLDYYRIQPVSPFRYAEGERCPANGEHVCVNPITLHQDEIRRIAALIKMKLGVFVS